MSISPVTSLQHAGSRPQNVIDLDWLALGNEDVIEAALPIVDAHHHLWDRSPYTQYLLPEFLEDISQAGHDIRGSVFIDCRSMYRADGDSDLRPLGEIEFANGIGAVGASGAHGTRRLCAGIVGFVDLRGTRVPYILESMISRAPERFRGVRQIACWDPDPEIRKLSVMPPPPAELLSDVRFLQGFGFLGRLGLSFDITVNHPQLPEAIQLADQHPDTTMVLTHMGGLLGTGPYAGRGKEVFGAWRKNIGELARRQNVHIKIGGIGMRKTGINFHDRALPPTSAELATVWQPYVQECIEAFGVERAMFESNFPMDKSGCSYRVMWNTFKRLAANASVDEKAWLFAKSAILAYRLDPALVAPASSAELWAD